jgi:hypothetical protein
MQICVCLELSLKSVLLCDYDQAWENQVKFLFTQTYTPGENL